MLLRSRADLRDDGFTDREMQARVAAGVLVRVRRGHYVPAESWRMLWPEGRHLLAVLAVHRDATTPPVFSHVSAAVIHGFPLYRHRPSRVHVGVPNPAHAGSVQDVLRHRVDLGDDDVVEVGGLRVTSGIRTAFDVSRTLRRDAAQSIADASLRRHAVTRNRQSAELSAQWREDLERRLVGMRGAPGTRRASEVIAFADGRAQLPGESVSRLRLHRLGFREIDLQVPVAAPGGGEYFVDFGLDEIHAFGEFDGVGKYVDPALRGDRSIEDAVLDEKRREDWVRGTTGRRLLRWGDEHIVTVDAFAERLAAFGVPLGAGRRLDRSRL